jgi:hypothetical protein
MIKKYNVLKTWGILFLGFSLMLTACQKLDRPEMGELVLDPPPPPLTLLNSKSYWHFNGNARDTGEFRLATTTSGVSFVQGVTEGEAAEFGSNGYIVARTLPDALKNPGSLSVAFWMNGKGPVQGGAQGLFAISNSTQFWGNFEMFLENLNNGAEAFLKIHMLNSGAAGGIGENWIEVKIPNALNKWTHIAVTYNAANSQITVYADGQPTSVNNKVLNNGAYGPLKFANASGLVIGSFAFQTSPSLTNHGPESWAKSFAGAIDQLRIFTEALTPAQVTNLYTNKL